MSKLGRNSRAVPWYAVTINDPYWSPRLQTLASVTLNSQWKQLHDTGRLAALGIWEGDGEAPSSHRFFDSDIAKWLEAVAYAQSWNTDKSLRTKAKRIISGYQMIQEDDGYCNQGFIDRPEKRFLNLRDEHELYCAGHLMEAAVAWHEALGDEQLLRVMERCCELIWREFGPDGKPGYSGHPELELALMRMATACDEPRWRELARLMVDRRGQHPSYFTTEAERREVARQPPWQASYWQDHKPVRDVETIEGHAVRALYLLAGMQDLADEDRSLADTCDSWWKNATTRRMYVTGGFGSHHHGEIFTHDFDLPNREAYTETCAAIAGAMVAQRRLAHAPSGHDGDVLERCLYNGMLAGFAIDGEHYFYANPLCVQPGIDQFRKHYRDPADCEVSRPTWYGCSCCPPNIARTLASLGGYVASADEQSLSLHLYIAGTIAWQGWRLRIDGDYTWHGCSTITIETTPSAETTLRLRLPSWRGTTTVHIDGTPCDFEAVDGYITIRRHWRGDERIALDFGLEPRRIYANPHINDDAGRVAIQRGPLVYCLEACDQQDELFSLRLPDDVALRSCTSTLLPGAMGVEADGLCESEPALYSFTAPQGEVVRLHFVPFPLWANRQAGAMQVWIPRC